jgi:ubiquitin-conjugating enzyme E2 G2
MAAMAAKRLLSEFKSLSDKPVPGIVAGPAGPDDMLRWTFTLLGPSGTLYEHGCFTGTLTFPADYPLSPPKMVFDPALLHPNVYGTGPRKGEVCISILHTGVDATGYERAEERWSPVHSAQSVLLSVLSMLSEPNSDSPANVDAAKLLRDQPAVFAANVVAEVERSLALRR